MSDKLNTTVAYLVGTLATIGVIAAVVLGGVAGCGAYKGWQRGQARANASNRVAITKINIQNEQQQAKVVTADNGVVYAQAQQRLIEARGVRHAQDEIAKTLTPMYLQYEAIKAEQAVATSGQNNTLVYVPSGPMGVPLVQNASNPASALPKH